MGRVQRVYQIDFLPSFSTPHIRTRRIRNSSNSLIIQIMTIRRRLERQSGPNKDMQRGHTKSEIEGGGHISKCVA